MSVCYYDDRWWTMQTGHNTYISDPGFPSLHCPDLVEPRWDWARLLPSGWLQNWGVWWIIVSSGKSKWCNGRVYYYIQSYRCSQTEWLVTWACAEWAACWCWWPPPSWPRLTSGLCPDWGCPVSCPSSERPSRQSPGWPAWAACPRRCWCPPDPLAGLAPCPCPGRRRLIARDLSCYWKDTLIYLHSCFQNHYIVITLSRVSREFCHRWWLRHPKLLLSGEWSRLWTLSSASCLISRAVKG